MPVVPLASCDPFSGCLSSIIRDGGFVQSQGSISVSSLCCWDPSDPAGPSDGPLHSRPQQPLCLSRHAPSDCSCGTALANFQHRAEPSFPEERPKTLVHLHRLVVGMNATQGEMVTSVKGCLLNGFFFLIFHPRLLPKSLALLCFFGFFLS